MDSDFLKILIFSHATAKYETCNERESEYLTQQLIGVFTAQPPLESFSQQLFEDTVKQVIIDPDGGIRLRMQNGKLIYLCSQRWGGNVRQLQNYIQRLCLLDTPLEINAQYLEHTSPVQNLFSDAQEQTHPRMVPLTQAMASFEKQYIQTALDQADSLVEAAQMLGIPLSTLNRKKKYHGLYRYPRYEGEYH